MEEYRFELVADPEEGDLGLKEVRMYPADAPEGEKSFLGRLEFTDKGVTKRKEAGDFLFSPYITFVGCEVPGADKDRVREIMDLIFAYMKENGVKEVSYCIGNKTKEPYLKNIGFTLAKENNESYYTIYEYHRVLAEEGLLSESYKQHGEDSTWDKF